MKLASAKAAIDDSRRLRRPMPLLGADNTGELNA